MLNNCYKNIKFEKSGVNNLSLKNKAVNSFPPYPSPATPCRHILLHGAVWFIGNSGNQKTIF
jgi:hypothetical protein